MREIKIGNVYKHFKNKYYIVIDIVNDCESNDYVSSAIKDLSEYVKKLQN